MKGERSSSFPPSEKPFPPLFPPFFPWSVGREKLFSLSHIPDTRSGGGGRGGEMNLMTLFSSPPLFPAARNPRAFPKTRRARARERKHQFPVHLWNKCDIKFEVSIFLRNLHSSPFFPLCIFGKSLRMFILFRTFCLARANWEEEKKAEGTFPPFT